MQCDEALPPDQLPPSRGHGEDECLGRKNGDPKAAHHPGAGDARDLRAGQARRGRPDRCASTPCLDSSKATKLFFEQQLIKFQQPLFDIVILARATVRATRRRSPPRSPPPTRIRAPAQQVDRREHARKRCGKRTKTCVVDFVKVADSVYFNLNTFHDSCLCRTTLAQAELTTFYVHDEGDVHASLGLAPRLSHQDHRGGRKFFLHEPLEPQAAKTKPSPPAGGGGPQRRWAQWAASRRRSSRRPSIIRGIGAAHRATGLAIAHSLRGRRPPTSSRSAPHSSISSSGFCRSSRSAVRARRRPDLTRGRPIRSPRRCCVP